LGSFDPRRVPDMCPKGRGVVSRDSVHEISPFGNFGTRCQSPGKTGYSMIRDGTMGRICLYPPGKGFDLAGFLLGFPFTGDQGCLLKVTRPHCFLRACLSGFRSPHVSDTSFVKVCPSMLIASFLLLLLELVARANGISVPSFPTETFVRNNLEVGSRPNGAKNQKKGKQMPIFWV